MEALEARTFLSVSWSMADSVTGAEMNNDPAPHHHHLHHFHNPHHRLHRHPSHTVPSDVLLGHFIGTLITSNGLHQPTQLTLARDVSGNLSGLLVLFNGFSFDTDFHPVVYSDGTFTLVAFGQNKVGGLQGSIIRGSGHRTILTGIYGGGGAGSGWNGTFTMRKV